MAPRKSAMKLFVSLVISSCAIIPIYAQDDSSPDYLRFPTIPRFTLLQVDSTIFTSDYLDKSKKTLILLFSPDCNHCRQQTDSMLAHKNELQNVQIVMATYEPFDRLAAFYKEYKMAEHSNFKLGRDTKYFFIPFYGAVGIPFLGLYTEKGDLITAFKSGTSIQKITAAFNKTEH